MTRRRGVILAELEDLSKEDRRQYMAAIVEIMQQRFYCCEGFGPCTVLLAKLEAIASWEPPP